ncbi:hypothetical protein QJS10_CPB15g01884 [Acorus calamus]|uniref:Uncharacterized protein n=1 Tax=Acorus calamus TaxID=4465 RepID=A0AAV9D8K0_ACOCL|nr:hypothetical protein QJS10_CPB15g01884 [Acorus calamus]
MGSEMGNQNASGLHAQDTESAQENINPLIMAHNVGSFEGETQLIQSCGDEDRQEVKGDDNRIQEQISSNSDEQMMNDSHEALEAEAVDLMNNEPELTSIITSEYEDCVESDESVEGVDKCFVIDSNFELEKDEQHGLIEVDESEVKVAFDAKDIVEENFEISDANITFFTASSSDTATADLVEKSSSAAYSSVELSIDSIYVEAIESEIKRAVLENEENEDKISSEELNEYGRGTISISHEDRVQMDEFGMDETPTIDIIINGGNQMTSNAYKTDPLEDFEDQIEIEQHDSNPISTSDEAREEVEMIDQTICEQRTKEGDQEVHEKSDSLETNEVDTNIDTVDFLTLADSFENKEDLVLLVNKEYRDDQMKEASHENSNENFASAVITELLLVSVDEGETAKRDIELDQSCHQELLESMCINELSKMNIAPTNEDPNIIEPEKEELVQNRLLQLVMNVDSKEDNSVNEGFAVARDIFEIDISALKQSDKGISSSATPIPAEVTVGKAEQVPALERTGSVKLKAPFVNFLKQPMHSPTHKEKRKPNQNRVIR